MKLSDCKMGVLVCTDDMEVGHVVGLAYTATENRQRNMSHQELLDWVVPVVKFPDNERAVHHYNLSIFEA